MKEVSTFRRAVLVFHALKPLLASHYRMMLLGLTFSLFNRLSLLILPACIGYVTDSIVVDHRVNHFSAIITLMLFAAVVEAVSARLCVQTLTSSVEQIVADLRAKIHSHILHMPVRFFDRAQSGELVSRVIYDTDALHDLVGSHMSAGVSEILYLIVCVAYLIHLSPVLAGVALLLLGLGFVPILLGSRRVGALFLRRRELSAALSAWTSELISGIRTIRIFRTEHRQAVQFEDRAKTVAAVAISAKRLRSTIESSSALALGVALTVVIYVGAREIARDDLSVGRFVSFMIVLSSAMWPILNVIEVWTRMIDGLTGLGRVVELAGNAYESRSDSRLLEMPETGFAGSVQFDRVSFCYDEGCDVLRDVSFRAQPGTVTALVGPSGAGKSTIMSILAGFYAPVRGTVRIDGMELSKVRLDSYRKHLALVQQSTFLFHGTIRENVLLAKPAATEVEFIAACRASGVDQFVERLPDKFDTQVGERGVRLSGGQQQRISIARALLANPRILLLDEATANLDMESEAAINEALTSLMSGRTTIVVAHRLSTVRRADQVLVIDHGNIIEYGTHETLTSTGRRYRELYERELFARSAPGD